MDWIALFSAIIAILLVGFFSGMEIAFITANRLTIELRRKQGTISGKIWGSFSDRPTKFIGTLLIGANFVLVVYGLLIGGLLSPLWNWMLTLLPAAASDYVHYVQLLVETILSTVIFLFVEIIFKALFRARNESIISSNLISRMTLFFYQTFSSLASVAVSISEWILKYIFSVKIYPKKEAFSKQDLEQFLHQSKRSEEEETTEINKTLFENALTLSETKIRKCLVPRNEILAVEQGKSISEIKATLIETKLSRIIVYEKDIDNIVGYIHHLDLFKNPATIKEILHPIMAVPETMSATELMNRFTKQRKSIAWVIDEFGGTSGIITMEDLLEEIFGEIEDEYDLPETHVDKQIAVDEYIFAGRMELDTIAEKYDLIFLYNHGNETLSGYIIQHHKSIPSEKETIYIGNMEFNILHVSETRIETVKLKIVK